MFWSKKTNFKEYIKLSDPEYILKNKCIKVLGLDEFDEEIFSENITDINLLAPIFRGLIFKHE